MALDLCKYYKKQRFVSYNNGLTWQPLDEYERGELYEAHSASCGAGVFQYRWVLINNGYICDGKDRYTREIYQYSEDGTVWYNVFPTQYRKGTLVETDSPFCDNGGNGEYTSGDTEPTSGDTPPCPTGYFWNGTECECNGEVIDGVCHPCPTNYKYNKTTHECECQGHFDNYGNCIVCAKNEYWNETTKQCECSGRRDEFGNCIECPPHSTWDEQQEQCVCEKWWKLINGVCVYVDPLKIFKCSDSDGVLRQSDVNYYESGWAVMSYTIGDCIYRIDDNAFNGQQVMTSVTIPNSVEEVGTLAFANCNHLPSIHFPSNITSFGTKIFYGCSSLRVVNFGGTIPSTIQPYMFDGCFSLESASWLNINNITTIGEGAFRFCSALSNVTFPQSLTYIGNAAFINNYSLTNITIPSGVTEIGYNAFANCIGLTFVNIDSNNILLNNAVFANCTNLTAATFNSSAVRIGSDVFYGCTRLLKLTFTSPTPFEIEDGDFDNTNECAIFVPCGSLEAYKTAWYQYADRISCNDTGVYYRWVLAEGTYCVGYDEYTREKKQSTTNGITWTDTGDYRLKDLITHYSENCGYSDEVALTVTGSDGITRYYEPCNEQPTPDVNKLLANYSDNTTYTLACNGDSDLLQSEIRDYTTSYSSMTSAVVGNCVTYIENNAFNQCSSLFNVTLPSTVSYIGSWAFGNCNNVAKLIINAEYPPMLYGYNNELPSNGCPIYVPCNSVDAYKEAWSDYADRIRCNDEGLSYRWINDGTICVNNELFFKQKQQISWDNEQNWHDTGEIRTTGSTIGDCAKLYATFESSDPYIINCTSLGSIKQSEVRGTDYQNIKSITLGGCVTSIDNSTFNRCLSMTSIVIPNGVTSIGDSAFRECTSLTSVTIPDSVTSLARWAFIACGSLTSVRIGSGITSWGDAAFSGCTNISEITINSGATIIGNSAFTYSNINNIAIPNTVTSIGSYAFRDCHNLASIVIPDSVVSLGTAAFYNCSGATSCYIGSGVTSIGWWTFQGCKGLTSIDIPDSVTSIGDDAFNNCSNVTTVTIGSGVTSIGSYAFQNCASLTSITINATTPPSLDTSRPFGNTNLSHIYVPAESVDAYKAARNWSSYASIIQAIPN